MQQILDIAGKIVEQAYARARRLVPDIYNPHTPSEKQIELLRFKRSNGVVEALYGGAAGGGKSDALLMAALQYVHIPTYSAILFRRSYADLARSNSLMDRLKKWLRPARVHWNQNEHRFTFPSGATIEFGYCNNEGDEERYFGSEWQFIGIDELTQFTEKQYQKLKSRLRRNLDSLEVPMRIFTASNPGGVGHDWVKEYFVESEQDDKRRFFPARLVDNPGIDQQSYIENLGSLDEITRRQLLEGDWNARDDSLLAMTEIIAAESLCLWEHSRIVNPLGWYYAGIDIGRKHDLTVLWIAELIKDVLWTRKIVRLFNTRYSDQLDIISAEFKKLRRVSNCLVDQGGIGNQMAEDLAERFPFVEPIGLSSRNMGVIAKALKVSFTREQIRIPQEDRLREALRGVEKVGESAGIPFLKTKRDKQGHCDEFWALALCRYGVGSMEVQEATGRVRTVQTTILGGR